MTQGAPKKTIRLGGNRVSKVQKAKKANARKVDKKFTSGLVAKTEALLGERAGHMELIGKGKKKTDKTLKHKMGSRKFG